ncbi:unnamed protein product [Linum tenue]|uniref:Glutaredoxin domain-containing protein n=1 Tax=Linum tenue TaxID=586396 RepID=A0AAV0JHE8_9ROSI|nr:unnamed protein product [Linum tenue]
MGCASSKRIEATVDIYRPPPSSFSVFDITSVQEPWLSSADDQQPEFEKPAGNNVNAPNPLLDKLQKFESPDAAPRSWDEVSKALEDLKPAIKPKPISAAVNPPPPKPPVPAADKKPSAQRRSFSFHTLEELDSKLSAPKPSMRKSESARNVNLVKIATGADSRLAAVKAAESTPSTAAAVVIKPVRENIFILRDKMEREKEGKSVPVIKRDPLSDFPELCPPGGNDSVVVYTTSLRGIRKTFDDCTRVANLMELQRVATDERDVSLHGGFLNELKELLGESAAGLTLPRVFIKGRYVGGVEEVEALNESGKLGRILSWARVERGAGRHACEGCGGARFVPCLDCGGSCKVVVDGVNKERCGKCNENGLVHCPACG